MIPQQNTFNGPQATSEQSPSRKRVKITLEGEMTNLMAFLGLALSYSVKIANQGMFTDPNKQRRTPSQ